MQMTFQERYVVDDQLEHLEIELLLEGLFRHYGIDFREYAYASLRRRIWNFVRAENLSSISGLQEKLLHEPDSLDRFVSAVSVSVTAMFRDPSFYRAMRQKVLPMLRTYATPNIWHAGCASGEEVYSMAILLQEEGLLQRCRLYATDIDDAVLQKARSGIFSLSLMKDYTKNYMRSGGSGSFSDYYSAKHGNAILDQSLRRNITFANHNLATDSSFNEFNLIICRNVMIYFRSGLQERVLDLLHTSLSLFGVLALGNRESLNKSNYATFYEDIDSHERLYKRIA